MDGMSADLSSVLHSENPIHSEAEACIVIMNDKSASMTAIVQMASKPLITVYFFIMYF